jgi:hypothetical protein
VKKILSHDAGLKACCLVVDGEAFRGVGTGLEDPCCGYGCRMRREDQASAVVLEAHVVGHFETHPVSRGR